MIHALCARSNPSENIAPAYDDCQFHTKVHDLGDFFGHAQYRGAINAKRIFAHERFARKFKKYAFVRSGGHSSIPSRQPNGSVSESRACVATHARLVT